MKNLFKLFNSHLKFIAKEYIYILKGSTINKEFLFLSLILSFKFLYYAGIKNMIYKKIYHKNKKDYLKLVDEKLILSHDWFSNNITTWINIFSEQNLKKKLEILEIGSYEGASAVFFVNFFNSSNLTCIETFDGSDEHKEIDFKKVKKNFDHNLQNFKTRVKLFLGKSHDFFQNKTDNELHYDIIYIDGSHHFEDVYLDAENSLKRLKKNGIIIFDDFLKNIIWT